MAFSQPSLAGIVTVTIPLSSCLALKPNSLILEIRYAPNLNCPTVDGTVFEVGSDLVSITIRSLKY